MKTLGGFPCLPAMVRAEQLSAASRAAGQTTLATLPERRHRVQMRMCLRDPPARICTRCRLGRWMLLVLMFEWLTRLATCLSLPQISHCAGMGSPKGASISTC